LNEFSGGKDGILYRFNVTGPGTNDSAIGKKMYETVSNSSIKEKRKI